tara:strand:+ start:1400 stop:1735 length:336 start_codon:yes stop_codon:yes gene_type:complete
MTNQQEKIQMLEMRIREAEINVDAIKHDVSDLESHFKKGGVVRSLASTIDAWDGGVSILTKGVALLAVIVGLWIAVAKDVKADNAPLSAILSNKSGVKEIPLKHLKSGVAL